MTAGAGAPGRRRGTTIIEVLVSCVIFAILVAVCFALMKYGTTSWQRIETRMDAQKSIQLAKNMLRTELTRTSFPTTIVYQQDDDYRHAICFKSAMDAKNEEFRVQVDSGKPLWQKYVLFYVAKPQSPEYHAGAACQAETGQDSAAGHDLKCPHKWLIRKDISLDANIASPAGLLPFLAEPSHKASLDAPETYVTATKLVAEGILGFSITRVDTPAMRGFDITLKIFKSREAASVMKVGESDLSASPFTIQVNTSVIPLD